MKPFFLLISVVILGTALGAVAWVSTRSVPVNDEHGAATDPQPRRSLNPLEISEQGPYPRAVLTESLHRFPTMQFGETGSHSFIVKNNGDAPLLLETGEITCKCTYPTLPEDPVPPGESAEVLVTWTPDSQDSQFFQRVTVWTNDPKNELLKLDVTGKVAWLLYPLPSKVWMPNSRLEVKGPAEFSGSLISTAEDEFRIIDHNCTVDSAQVEFEPMTQEEIQEVNTRMGAEVRCGYNINLTIEGPIPLGLFREKLTIVTDVQSQTEQSFFLNGNVAGPYYILGKGWDGRQMKLNLGNVEASKGKSITLSMFLPRQDDQPLRLRITERNPKFLQFKSQRVESYKSTTQERYALKLSVPTESPTGSWQGSDMGMIRVETNREGIPELELSVEMVVK